MVVVVVVMMIVMMTRTRNDDRDGDDNDDDGGDGYYDSDDGRRRMIMQLLPCSCQLYCDRAENLMEEGSSLCQGAHYESVGIRERRRLLADVYRNFCTTLEERRKKLELCMEFHQLALQVSSRDATSYTETMNK